MALAQFVITFQESFATDTEQTNMKIQFLFCITSFYFCFFFSVLRTREIGSMAENPKNVWNVNCSNKKEVKLACFEA